MKRIIIILLLTGVAFFVEYQNKEKPITDPFYKMERVYVLIDSLRIEESRLRTFEIFNKKKVEETKQRILEIESAIDEEFNLIMQQHKQK